MGYYSEKLSGNLLKRCYEVASPRVRRYLEAEVNHLACRLEGRGSVLELGCGYGRVSFGLAPAVGHVTGIDTSKESLLLAREMGRKHENCIFAAMDATRLGFVDNAFDAVVCVQNGICAFNVDMRSLVEEALRVARPGGLVIFSSYSERFWPHRLEWFETQAAAGLLGEIDYEATGDGVIVCRDGFRAGALGEAWFGELFSGLGIEPRISEIDRSSIFCEVEKP